MKYHEATFHKQEPFTEECKSESTISSTENLDFVDNYSNQLLGNFITSKVPRKKSVKSWSIERSCGR